MAGLETRYAKVNVSLGVPPLTWLKCPLGAVLTRLADRQSPSVNFMLKGKMMTGHIDPTKDVFAAFRENNRPGRIHMLNLVRLHAQARYPDRRKATGAKPMLLTAASGRCSRGSAAVSSGRQV
jgi:hypothetical protein